MTEDKAQEIQHTPKEEIDYDKLRTNWGMNVTKSTVRLKIWQILQLFGELNVTQIANHLKESKSTVSRHLSGMVDDHLVKMRVDESCCEGRIPPKVFSINKEVMKGSMGEIGEDFDNQSLEDKINFIKAEIQTNRSSIEMITGIMQLLHPIYDQIESLIREGTEESHEKAVKIFKKYMWKHEKNDEKIDNTTWFMFKYSTPESNAFGKKFEKFMWSALKDDFDAEKFEEERLKFKAEHEKIKEAEKDPMINKKYGHFCIDMPLRTIFKRNLPERKR